MPKTFLRICFFSTTVLFSSANVSATEEFSKNEAYCQADLVFIGVAKKTYFEKVQNGDWCGKYKTPKTVQEFADQANTMGMICFPLIVEVQAQETLYPFGATAKITYKLHTTFAPPIFASSSMEEFVEALKKSPHIYSVFLLEAYEENGYTWLAGYPRDIAEASYLRNRKEKIICDKK